MWFALTKWNIHCLFTADSIIRSPDSQGSFSPSQCAHVGLSTRKQPGMKKQSPPQRIPAGSLNVFSLRFILTCRRSIENTIFLFKFCIMYIRVSIILRAWNASQTACSNNISPNWTDIFITKKFRKKQYFGNILYPHPSPILFGSQKGLPSLRRSLPLIFLFNFLAPTHNCAKRLQA